ncbi:MAG TPA: hypothetical protein VN181_02990, partial [Thermoanaerobaculia bacterium]|nr:hypothetical protein [Thermoanaerobaculia bacterium]
MTMHRIFRRSIFWLVPLILLPMAVLLVLQYRFLRSLENATASAERNHLRNSLEAVTEQIESTYRLRAEHALTMSEVRLKDVGHLGEHFRNTCVPGARTFFAIRYKGQMSEWGVFDSKGHEREPMMEEGEAIKMATVSWQVAHKREHLLSTPSLSVDERDPHHRVIMRPVVDDSLHVVGVVGVVLDEVASKNAMMNIGAKALKRRYRGLDLALKIGDRFPPMPRGREFVTQPMGFIFTNWRAGLRDVCMG